MKNQIHINSLLTAISLTLAGSAIVVLTRCHKKEKKLDKEIKNRVDQSGNANK